MIQCTKYRCIQLLRYFFLTLYIIFLIRHKRQQRDHQDYSCQEPFLHHTAAPKRNISRRREIWLLKYFHDHFTKHIFRYVLIMLQHTLKKLERCLRGTARHRHRQKIRLRYNSNLHRPRKSLHLQAFRYFLFQDLAVHD